MVTYIHAPDLQRKIVGDLIKKYGKTEVANCMMLLFKVSDYQIRDIDNKNWQEDGR